MNISLTPALEQFVNDKVSTGLYNSVSEVIREALRLLISKETPISQDVLDRLNRDIEDGINDTKSLEGHSALKSLMKKYD